MAPRDPSKAQLDFPQLIADIIEQLQLTGQLGLLDFSDVVVPVYLIAQRDAIVASQGPSFASAEIFSGSVLGPANSTIIVDTGPLPAGTYDCIFGMSYTAFGATSEFILQWRNAANAADLATWPVRMSNLAEEVANIGPFTTALEISLNERLRWFVTVGNAGGALSAFIMAAARPIP